MSRMCRTKEDELELDKINARIPVVENKIDFMNKHRGAVSGSAYGTELIKLRHKKEKIEKRAHVLAENEQFLTEIERLKLMEAELTKKYDISQAELKEQEIGYNYIKNHPEIFEEYKTKIAELTEIFMTKIAELTTERDSLAKENTQLKAKLI